VVHNATAKETANSLPPSPSPTLGGSTPPRLAAPIFYNQDDAPIVKKLGTALPELLRQETSRRHHPYSLRLPWRQWSAITARSIPIMLAFLDIPGCRAIWRLEIARALALWIK